MTKEEGRKLQKKLKRKQALFLREEPHLEVNFQEQPSQHVFLGNGGTQNGLGREVLLELLGKQHVVELYMPPGKDYAFVTYSGTDSAMNAVELSTGICVQEFCRHHDLLHMLNPSVVCGAPLHLYLCYVDRIPQNVLMSEPKTSSELPPGLVLILDYISVEEETKFLEFFATPPYPCPDVTIATTEGSKEHEHITAPVTSEPDGTTDSSGIKQQPSRSPHTQCTSLASFSRDWTRVETKTGTPLHSDVCSLDDQSFAPPEAVLKHRRVKHYGYEFLYGSSNVDPSNPLPGGLPDICLAVLRRMVDSKLIPVMPDQLTVNEYLPGAGIPPHVDTHSAFEDGIISLSLGSGVVMDFKHPGGKKISVILSRRSLLVMTGESRYLWTHGISARKTDTVHPQMPGHQCKSPCATSQGSWASSAVPRAKRVSLTFRKVRQTPCDCCYPQQCDSQKQAYS